MAGSLKRPSLSRFWACSLGVRLRFAQANSWQKQHFRSLRASLTARSSELCPEAPGHVSLEVRLSERSSVQNKNFEFQNPFSPTLQFWSSHTQNSSQMKFIGHVHKHIHQNAQNSWIKHDFCLLQNFIKLSKLFNNNNNNFHHQFNNGMLNIPIYQQHVSQTSTTTIIQEFISSPSNHKFIIHHFSQKHNIFIHMIFDIWFQSQQQLFIQFTCINILSTIQHKFIHQISHKHLFSKLLNWIITYEKG